MRGPEGHFWGDLCATPGRVSLASQWHFPDCWGWDRLREGGCLSQSLQRGTPTSKPQAAGRAHPTLALLAEGESSRGRAQAVARRPRSLLSAWDWYGQPAGLGVLSVRWGARLAFPVQVQFSVAQGGWHMWKGCPRPCPRVIGPGLCAGRGTFSTKPLRPCSHRSCHSPSGGPWSWIRTDHC